MVTKKVCGYICILCAYSRFCQSMGRWVSGSVFGCTWGKNAGLKKKLFYETGSILNIFRDFMKDKII